MTGDTLKLTKAQTDKLIDHVRDREVLYNLTHKDYHKCAADYYAHRRSHHTWGYHCVHHSLGWTQLTFL